MEFVNYIKIGFVFNGKRYTHEVKKSELDREQDPDTWFAYFDEDGYHFEVWGGLDDEGEPATSGSREDGTCIQFAVNCYEVVDGYSELIEQVDDVDVEECV